MHTVCKNAFPLTGFDHNGACAVAEKNTSRSVVPVKQSAQHFCAHNKGSLVTTGANQTVCHTHGVDKTGTYRLNVKSRTTFDAQGILQSAGHRGK